MAMPRAAETEVLACAERVMDAFIAAGEAA
jgi:hypothetical protein